MKRIFIFLFVSLFITGVMAQNVTELKPAEIPKKITEYLNKNLVTYSVVRAAKSDYNGVIKYKIMAESNGRKAIYLFDKDFKIIVRKKNMNGKEQPKPVPPITPSGKKTDEKPAPIKK